jgi:GAF domain-containing protein
MAQEITGPAVEHPDHIAPAAPDSATSSPPEYSGETMTTDSQNHGPPSVQEIAQIITSATDFSQASQPFFNAIQNLVDCQVASIYAVNEATDIVTTLLFASTLPIQRKTGDTWPFSGNSIELHLKLGYPHIQDLNLDNPFPGTRKYLEAGIKCGLWVPLTYQGRSTGLLILRNTKSDAFSPHHLADLSHLATLIAPSVEKAMKL